MPALILSGPILVWLEQALPHGLPQAMAEKFERHRQPWTPAELQKLHTLAKKGMGLKSIAKALTRTEESVKDRAKADGLSIAKLR
jgi:DNA-binding NarL/FixJ family response regulator